MINKDLANTKGVFKHDIKHIEPQEIYGNMVIILCPAAAAAAADDDDDDDDASTAAAAPAAPAAASTAADAANAGVSFDSNGWEFS